MKKTGKIKSFAIILVTAAVILLFMSVTNYVLKPKYLYGDGFPTTATYKGFYGLEDDSQKLLFLGSSHGATGFDPRVIKDMYGVESYNLSCEQQNLFTTYYWLKEALKTQKPEAVVLEASMLFLFTDEELAPKNANCTRKAFDFMKPSLNKLEAQFFASEVSKELTFTSMLLPQTVYHTRWKDLSAKDFTFKVEVNDEFLRGFYPLFGSGVSGYSPVADSAESEIESYDRLMYYYLEKIAEVCKEQDIKLVLVSTPSTLESVERNCALHRVREILGVELIDFNDADVYDASGYDFYTDNNDDDHANENGAAKITAYIGKILWEQ